MKTPKTWKALSERRGREHRARCAETANRAVDSLSKLGVKVLIFGSLAEAGASFRPDSDVDLCVVDPAGVPFAEIERVVAEVCRSIPCDLVRLDDLKADVREEVLAKGVTHVH